MKYLALLPCLFATLPSTLWAQLPAGGEFQVNTYTTSNQSHPSVSSDDDGNWVVVWAGDGQDGSSNGIFGKRFNASGLQQGSEFQVNTYTTNSQDFAVVVSNGNGDFVVVWESNGQDGGGWGVFGQRFDASGAPVGSEFQVNSYTTNDQRFPRASIDASGTFVVVWNSYGGQDGSQGGVFGQRFNASGVRQGSEFRVNSYTTYSQSFPSVATHGSGDFVVVWSSVDPDGDGFNVYGQRFDASGVPQGSEFLVNSFTTGDQVTSQAASCVASDASGNFVVVWHSFGQGADASLGGIFGQRFDALGVPQGTEFAINSYTSNNQWGPSVAMEGGGNFVVVWNSTGQDGSSEGVFGQRFNASAVPQASEFQINSYTTGSQADPEAALSSTGDFLVAWQSTGQDGSVNGVFGQRYGDMIFRDGFESGELSRWSSAQTGGGDLSVIGAAGMGGTSSGLQALVNDTGALFVHDDTPSAESRYRVRFYFDPNGFDPGEAASHFRVRVLIAFDQSSRRTITLVLKRQLGAYSVEVRVRRNDGTRADTGFFPITDAPHFFEFDWQRSTGPGTSDGSLQLWLDGISKTTLSGIDNDQSAIESVRMGALSLKTGAAGTMYYDQFESRRERLIGAE